MAINTECAAEGSAAPLPAAAGQWERLRTLRDRLGDHDQTGLLVCFAAYVANDVPPRVFEAFLLMATERFRLSRPDKPAVRQRPTREQLQRLCDDFNGAYPVGTPVLLRTDSGVMQTKVRAAAVIFCGHSAVAWFEGIAGAYSIEGDRVSPAEQLAPDLTA